METLVPHAICHVGRISIATAQATEFVDLTGRIEALAAEAGFRTGMVNVQSLQSTAAIVVNEHDPLLLVDFSDVLARLVPKDAPYRHDDPNAQTLPPAPGRRPHGHAHGRALLLPSSAVMNVADGRLQLGHWQRIFLVELDGPATREVSVLFIGEACDKRT